VLINGAMAAEQLFAPTIVLYHKECPDGVCSAWAVWRTHPEALYVACRAGERPKCSFAKERVLYVDLSPGPDYVDELCARAAAVLVLDHHATAAWIKTDQRFEGSIVDMERAGCQLAWDYYNPGQARPWFVNYVADRDLWTWALPDSKAVNTALFECGHLNSVWSVSQLHAAQEKGTSAEDFRLQGDALLRIREKKVDAEVDRATRCLFISGDDVFPIWLSSCPPDLRSEVGNALMACVFKDGSSPEFAAIYSYDFAQDAWSISLRSNNEHADVSEIAKSFGGGGHRNAAGFTLRAPNLHSEGSPFRPRA
jgi:hypothetical protein